MNPAPSRFAPRHRISANLFSLSLFRVSVSPAQRVVKSSQERKDCDVSSAEERRDNVEKEGREWSRAARAWPEWTCLASHLRMCAGDNDRPAMTARRYERVRSGRLEAVRDRIPEFSAFSSLSGRWMA